MGSISDVLEQQHSQLSQLLQMLDRELHLISVREPDELLGLVEEKDSLLDAIQQTDNEIATLYNEQGERFTEQQQAIVDSNLELLDKCKYNTSINQKAVEQGQLKLAHLRQLIIDVRAKESLTYDKSGATKGGTLGKGISA